MGNPIVETVLDRLIPTVEIPILVRWQLYIDSAPRLTLFVTRGDANADDNPNNGRRSS